MSREPCLYFHNARFYSTTVGAFASADSQGSQGSDRYAYVSDNPLRYTDPTGHRLTDTGGGNGDCALCDALVALANAGIFSPQQLQERQAAANWASVAPAPAPPPCEPCIALQQLAAAGLTSPEKVQAALAASRAASPHGGCGPPSSVLHPAARPPATRGAPRGS